MICSTGFRTLQGSRKTVLVESLRLFCNIPISPQPITPLGGNGVEPFSEGSKPDTFWTAKEFRKGKKGSEVHLFTLFLFSKKVWKSIGVLFANPNLLPPVPASGYLPSSYPHYPRRGYRRYVCSNGGTGLVAYCSLPISQRGSQQYRFAKQYRDKE